MDLSTLQCDKNGLFERKMILHEQEVRDELITALFHSSLFLELVLKIVKKLYKSRCWSAQQLDEDCNYI